MNEDELRAFLESATVGDSETEADTESEEAKDPAAGMSFEELMRMKRGDSSPSESAGSASAAEASARPSAPGASQEPPAAPATSEPPVTEVLPQASEPELTPIVLPGPPRPASKPDASEPFWEPKKAAPAAAAPAASETPSTAPLPSGSNLVEDPASDLFGSDPLPSPGSEEEYERISVVGSEKPRSKFVPWLIVGLGAVLAIAVSIVIVLAVRGGGESEPQTEPTTQSPPATSEPTEETPVEPTETEPETPAADEPPEVEVGNTGSFKIDSWGVQGEISAKFGWPSYKISGDTLTFEGGTLLPQFPDSCAAMRTGFGITKKADGSFEVFRPAETCAEAPDFYNEVWGLTAAIIPTLKAA